MSEIDEIMAFVFECFEAAVEEEIRRRNDPLKDPKMLEYAISCAYYKAVELVGHYGFTRSDVDDLQAEFLLRLVQQAKHYNPKRGRWSTFLNQLNRNHAANLIDYRKAVMRDYRKTLLIG